jgi:hypothetical protein
MKTAVEWLESKLTELSHQYELPEDDIDELLEQANKMFEEQVKDAYNDGVNDECIGGSKTPEQYYNETFKSE